MRAPHNGAQVPAGGDPAAGDIWYAVEYPAAVAAAALGLSGLRANDERTVAGAVPQHGRLVRALEAGPQDASLVRRPGRLMAESDFQGRTSNAAFALERETYDAGDHVARAEL